MATKPGTLAQLARELAQALQPLKEELKSQNADHFLVQLGLRLPDGFTGQGQVTTALSQGVTAATDLGPPLAKLIQAIQNENVPQIIQATQTLIDKITKLVQAVNQLATAIDSLSSSFSGLTSSQRQQIADFAQKLPRRLLDMLIIEYLRDQAANLLDMLVAFGLIDDVLDQGVPDNPLFPPFRRRALHLNRLGSLIFEPENYLKTVFNWGSSNFDGSELFSRLQAFLEKGNLETALITPPNQPPILEVYIFRLTTDPSTSPPSLILRLRLPATQDYQNRFNLPGPWSLPLGAKARFETGLEVEIAPPLDVALKPQTGTARLEELSLGVEAKASNSKLLLLGQTDGPRLEAQRLAAIFGFSASLDTSTGQAQGQPVVTVEIAQGKAVLEFSEGDSFIRMLLSKLQFETDFDLRGRWQPGKGMNFEGSGGTELTVPANINLGVAQVQTITFGLGLSSGAGLKLEILTAISGSLGPVVVSIDRMGLDVAATFPDDRDGNLGPVDLSFAFNPPNGIGLGIEAGSVTGGGYLRFEPEKERYAGIAHLNLDIVTIKAVGLLTTRLPDGSSGFSLMVIITGEFPPIQLGFGFTLNGLGGLVGIHRTMQVEVLRQGIREGTLDTILFPEDPLRNASQIISDLRQLTPPARDQYIFGPLAMFGWGTPPIVTAELGLVLELVSPLRLVIVGHLGVLLPSEEIEPALVKINMDVLGVINFDRQEASLDATLYDSRVTRYPISGDMAMRLKWGQDAQFLLSVGGFNPRFQPPADFPELDRLTIGIIPGDNPRVRLQAYLALTSNTVQAGAKLDVYASESGFTIKGYLSFDALFQFSPFEFVVDMGAGVTLKKGASTLMKVKLDLTLEGPQPWHAFGQATFEVFMINASVDFDVKIGQEKQPQLEEADVWPELQTALADVRNWSAQLPSNGNHQLVTFRKIEPGKKELFVHPLGTLAVRQRVVPLGIAIEKFGNVKPSGQRKFSLEQYRLGQADPVSINGSGGGNYTLLKDQFAPAQYFQMTDEERVSAPAFEPMQAGLRLGREGLKIPTDLSDPGQKPTNRAKEYRVITVVIDEAKPHPAPNGQKTDTLSMEGMHAAAEFGAVAQAPLRNTGRAKFHNKGLDIQAGETEYLVATTDTLKPVNIEGLNDPNGHTYMGATRALRDHLDKHPADRNRLQVVARHELN